ncbi:MAG: hypothetical protein DMF06_05100 [Verrucomicrobia bacterium]|nr:MAG: hypothetical protein DMF06_05100 [Verrucomicrobiota bacterium]
MTKRRTPAHAAELNKAVADIEEFWFLSEAGIRGHFADEFAHENRRHKEAIERLQNSEAETLRAFRKTKGAE